jgi:hypothetical protein
LDEGDDSVTGEPDDSNGDADDDEKDCCGVGARELATPADATALPFGWF